MAGLMRVFHKMPCVAVVLLVIAAPVTQAVAGTTYNVSTTAGLQAAINSVNAGTGGDSIVLAPGVYTLPTSLRIEQSVSIEGDGSMPTVIEGDGTFTILDVRANNISVTNLTLRYGSPAISYEGSGTFVGTGVTITGSQTGFYPGDSGGATFFTNSTIANNTGSGIKISCAELHLTNVTVSNNDIGVYFDFPCGEQMRFRNSLIVENGQDCWGGGGFTPVGNASFDSDGTCVNFGFGPGLTTATPASIGLGSLASNGGPTATKAIPATSVAVNAGNNAVCPAIDQRGFLRSDGACDVGAYEYGATAGGGNTPAGSPVGVSPAPGVTVRFSQVTTSGNTTATTVGPLPPSGFQVDGLAYDISTTAAYTGSVQVCLPYNASFNPNPKIYHYEDVPPPTWLDRTTSVDAANHVVCGTVSSLSPFVVLADAQSQIRGLETTIAGFGLDQGIEKSLMAKLEAAWNAVQRGEPNAACGQLGALINFTNAQSGKKLTEARAAMVITAAQTIRTTLGCQ